MDNPTRSFGTKWLGLRQDGWPAVPVRSIFAERKEKSIPADTHLTPSQKYAVLPQTEYMKLTGGRVVLNLTGSDNMKHVEKGDFVVHLRSFQGGIEYSRYTGKVSNAYTVLTPKDTVIDSFYRYVLKSHGFISELSKTTDQLRDGQSIKYNQLALLKYPLPNRNIQQRIADFLDAETAKIDTLIAKQERLLELLEEKRRVTITQAVTRGLDPNVELKETNIPWLSKIPISWNVIMIKRLSEVKRGASPRPIEDPRYFDDFGEYSWVRIADVTRSGKYLEKTPQRLSTLGASLSVKREPGDIFVSIAASVGKPMITKIKCCIHDGFVYFPNLEGKMNFEFLWYIFTAGQCYGGLGKMGTQLNLNTETIGRIKIPLPSHKEQDSIVEFLNQEEKKFEQLKQKIQTQISLLRERRTSLISHAVTGKVRI